VYTVIQTSRGNIAHEQLVRHEADVCVPPVEPRHAAIRPHRKHKSTERHVVLLLYTCYLGVEIVAVEKSKIKVDLRVTMSIYPILHHTGRDLTPSQDAY
jgi:hypothetical protein